VASRSFFVTGTDTGVGKTLVATALLLAAGQRGYRTAGIKPLAAGAEHRRGSPDRQLFNADALALRAVSTKKLDYELVNPWVFQPPIAPHIAAAQADVELSVANFTRHFERLEEFNLDVMVVEGAGGWLVPLNDSETLADVCLALRMPVILVVGLQLGCLNHALLTVEAIENAGLECAGWVANSVAPGMAAHEENLVYLRGRLPGPCLGVLPFSAGGLRPDAAIRFLDFDPLLQP
jgi:dethiobiotin synthetase